MLLGGVWPHQCSQSADGRNFKAAISTGELSGQEASRSSLPWHLSLWQPVRCPSPVIGRWIIGIVVVLGTTTMGWTTINVALNPTDAVAQKIAETWYLGIAHIAPNIDVSYCHG